MRTTDFLFILLLFLEAGGQVWGQEKPNFNIEFFNHQGNKIDKENLSRVEAEKLGDSISESENEKLINMIKELVDNKEREKIGTIHMNQIGFEVLNTTNAKHRFWKKASCDFFRPCNNNYEQNKNEITKSTVLKPIEEELKKYQSSNLTDTTAYIKFANEYEVHTVKIHIIDSITLTIRNGLIEHLQVFSGDRSFYNTKAPISLLSLDNRFTDKLYDPATGNYIFLKNALRFYASRRFNFIPDNEEITLTRKKPNQIVYADKNLNTLLDIQTYTDLLGLLGDEPNGLFQIEASSKFYLHRSNIRNRFIYFCSEIEPFFHYSKIDSKFETLAVNSDELNPTAIFHRRNYTVGLNLNIIQWDFKPANSLVIKTGYQYNSTKIDINDNKTNAITHLPYVEAGLKSNRLKGFGLNINYRYSCVLLNPNPLFDVESKTKLMSFHANLNYRPTEKSGNEIFLRFANYLDINNRKNDFSILQVGMRTSLKIK